MERHYRLFRLALITGLLVMSVACAGGRTTLPPAYSPAAAFYAPRAPSCTWTPAQIEDERPGSGFFTIAVGDDYDSSSSSYSYDDEYAWAAGYEKGGTEPYMLRWNPEGHDWRETPFPVVSNISEDVVAIGPYSRTDAWAVGYYAASQSMVQPLISHWNGMKWSIVKSPTFPHGALLSSVAAYSTTYATAVGRIFDANDNPLSLIENWDGKKWTPESPGRYGLCGPDSKHCTLSAVAFLSAPVNPPMTYIMDNRDVLHVEITDLLVRQDTKAPWTYVKTEKPQGATTTILNSFSFAGKDLLGIGFSQVGTSSDQSLIEHYDGKSFSIQSTPHLGKESFLTGVAYSPKAGAIAVGGYLDTNNVESPYALGYNGVGWTKMRPPNLGKGSIGLDAIAALQGTSDFWVAGNYMPVGKPKLSKGFIDLVKCKL